ncbi:thiolase family protein [Propionibacterium freudenreichii]|uniref:thiolase family protein n=1 Tax=Propionibacterium freudenreichii TaxID=1744 RepID=UPI00254F92DA|nr:thiolase family protein [Propionibacterium freudenreichii]MDK9302420.1 thiolase family protein [Propionibacterium freudenreichii]MDK9322366.1 thiolase family protein [Propionibacterium freudenreichii]MDK9324356.1 thiolase family protein [Propionibacterium freudenreichii]MDK9340421.1 thiolase family protein [Propionibacterium freudenreichii]MDK9649258.1 thiolase family protein [Propionibacterium freudenreichii]
MNTLADNPVIIEALRTPIGTTGGVFADQTTTDLAAPVLGELDARLPTGTGFGEVVLGNVRGPGGDPARVAALAAGIDPAVPALTLDRQCGSGMAAIEYAWHRCRSQPGVVAAGGVQAASTQPITLWPGRDGEPPSTFDRAPFAPPPWLDPDMGVMADQLAAELHISRERQDRYALRSHTRAATARNAGAFDAEIVPIARVGHDQRPRSGFTMARLARFPAAFRPGGTVTAANSCGINDAAAAVTMVDAVTHAHLASPGLRILAARTVGYDPDRFGLGLVPAVRAALDDAGLGLDQIDALEFNEAFAAQVLACADALDLDEHRLCPQGGAIALGHPWGASGAILLVRLFSRLVREGAGRYGLAAISIGGGQGSAVVVEAVHPRGN